MVTGINNRFLPLGPKAQKVFSLLASIRLFVCQYDQACLCNNYFSNRFETCLEYSLINVSSLGKYLRQIW